jgi:hypothetical protein
MEYMNIALLFKSKCIANLWDIVLYTIYTDLCTLLCKYPKLSINCLELQYIFFLEICSKCSVDKCLARIIRESLGKLDSLVDRYGWRDSLSGPVDHLSEGYHEDEYVHRRDRLEVEPGSYE